MAPCALCFPLVIDFLLPHARCQFSSSTAASPSRARRRMRAPISRPRRLPARICRRPLLGAASRLDPAPRASPASSPPGSDAVCRLIADCGEGEEEAPELLLLRIGRALLLRCLLEVELHHGAQGLRRRLSRDHASDDRNRGYMAVKAHFIDQSWTLQSRLVRFLHVPWPRTAEVNGLYVRMK